jgi:cell division protein FtsB
VVLLILFYVNINVRCQFTTDCERATRRNAELSAEVQSLRGENQNLASENQQVGTLLYRTHSLLI